MCECVEEKRSEEIPNVISFLHNALRIHLTFSFTRASAAAAAAECIPTREEKNDFVYFDGDTRCSKHIELCARMSVNRFLPCFQSFFSSVVVAFGLCDDLPFSVHSWHRINSTHSLLSLLNMIASTSSTATELDMPVARVDCY